MIDVINQYNWFLVARPISIIQPIIDKDPGTCLPKTIRKNAPQAASGMTSMIVNGVEERFVERCEHQINKDQASNAAKAMLSAVLESFRPARRIDRSQPGGSSSSPPGGKPSVQVAMAPPRPGPCAAMSAVTMHIAAIFGLMLAGPVVALAFATLLSCTKR